VIRHHWDAVPSTHRRWLLFNTVLGAAVSNLVANFLPAFVSSIGHRHIGLWTTPLLGGPNLLTDTAGTLFLLPFTTCIGVTLAVRRSRSKGDLCDLEHHQRGPRWLDSLPATIPRRSARLGLLVLLALGPLAFTVLAVWFHAGVERSTFIVYKTVLGLCLGFVVSPCIALAAMGDALPGVAPPVVAGVTPGPEAVLAPQAPS
jgi:hypothetical protein